MLCAAVAVMSEPFMTLPCTNPASTTGEAFPNVLFVDDPCRSSTRYLQLAGMTPQECVFGRHLVVSAILGTVIGYERRMADRPAGIRTMSLVSLASALFTVNSTFVFRVGPMHWDPGKTKVVLYSSIPSVDSECRIVQCRMMELMSTLIPPLLHCIQREFPLQYRRALAS